MFQFFSNFVDAYLSHNAGVDGLYGDFLTSQIESLHQWLEKIYSNWLSCTTFNQESSSVVINDNRI